MLNSCQEKCNFHGAQQVCKVRGWKLAEPQTDIEVEMILASPVLSYFNWWTGATTLSAASSKNMEFYWESDRVRPATSLMKIEWKERDEDKFGWWCATIKSNKKSSTQIWAANCSYSFINSRPLCHGEYYSNNSTTETNDMLTTEISQTETTVEKETESSKLDSTIKGK